MKIVKLINLNTDQVLAFHLYSADSFGKRLRGLMFTKNLPSNCGLLIRPCQRIHTYFMQYNIDVLHLDSNQQVITLEENLQPGKIGIKHSSTFEIIELPAGTIQKTDTKVGHQIKFVINTL
ncbi:DUF192 domain-containing protein [Clostridiaceae bacterium 35-E11]